jgi:hypothetical protein
MSEPNPEGDAFSLESTCGSVRLDSQPAQNEAMLGDKITASWV